MYLDTLPLGAASDLTIPTSSLDISVSTLVCRRPRPFAAFRGPEWDAYELLDITEQATTPEIRRAYHQRVRDWGCHPDMGGGPMEAEAFQRLAEAMAVLGNTERRMAYDRRKRTKAAVARIIVVAEHAVEFMVVEVAPVAAVLAVYASRRMGRILRQTQRAMVRWSRTFAEAQPALNGTAASRR